MNIFTVEEGATVTASGRIVSQGWQGNGTVAMGANQAAIYIMEDNAHTFTGTVTSSDNFVVYSADDRVLGDRLLGPTGGTTILAGSGASSKTLTLAAGLTCGNVSIYNLALTVDAAAGDWTVGNIVIGLSTNVGILKLGSGKHSVGSISKGGTGTTNAIYFQSCSLSASGNITLAGLATDFGTASIQLATGKSIIGASATSIASAGAAVHGGAVQNLAATAANPVYRFGRTGTDSGNGAGVIEMPSPRSGACAAIAA